MSHLFLKSEMFQTKFVEKISSKVSFFDNRAVFEIIWKNILEPGRTQVTIRRMRIARCIRKATNTHTEHVILVAFRLQEWLYERD